MKDSSISYVPVNPGASEPTHTHNGTPSGDFDRCSASQPCEVCGCHPQSPKGSTCKGLRSPDGLIVLCTRDDHAGRLTPYGDCTPTAYKHYMGGPCYCGETHARAFSLPATKPRAKPVQKPDKADPDTLNAVYGAMLDFLPLSTQTMKHLEPAVLWLFMPGRACRFIWFVRPVGKWEMWMNAICTASPRLPNCARKSCAVQPRN